MHNRRNVVIALSALIFLLIAVGLEHPYFHEAGADWKSIVFNKESLVGLSRELAFALIIALIITVGIESESRRADRESAERLRRDIAADVFRGVFSRVFTADYVDKVIAVNLEPGVVRKSIQIHYIIEEPNRKELTDLGLDPEDFVQLRTRVRYRLANISARPIDENIRVATGAVSNVRGALARLVSMKIGKGSEALVEKERETKSFEHQSGKGFSYEVNLDPGEEVEVAIETLAVKEDSDNEIWGTYYPTLQGDVTLTVRRAGLVTGLNARTATAATELFTSDDGSAFRWQINGPMLANDSLTLWWQPIERTTRI